MAAYAFFGEMTMEVYIESKPAFSEKAKSRAWTAFQILVGGLFLAACAQVRIPLYPVPLTLQTLGVFILATMQGGKKASYSVLFYLALVTLGLPVLAGGVSNSMWFVLPSAGYLFAFPIAAFVIGKMVYAKQKPSSLWVLASILVGQVIIYTLGVGFLMRFLSFKQSLMAGVVPFLLLAGVKLLLASTLGGLWLRWKKK